MILIFQDIHVMYLTDQEEYKHPFFQYNRTQSIVSLITSLVFLMHAIFLMDMILILPPTNTIDILESSENVSVHSNMEFQADNHLQLFCFLVPLWQSIKKVNLSQKMCWLCFKKFTKCNKCLITRKLDSE